MSFETISIHYHYPIIDDYVQVPNNEETDKTRVTSDEALISIPGSEVVRLTKGSGRQTGSFFGQQEVLRLPGIAPNEWFATNPVDDLSGD